MLLCDEPAVDETESCLWLQEKLVLRLKLAGSAEVQTNLLSKPVCPLKITACCKVMNNSASSTAKGIQGDTLTKSLLAVSKKYGDFYGLMSNELNKLGLLCKYRIRAQTLRRRV